MRGKELQGKLELDPEVSVCSTEKLVPPACGLWEAREGIQGDNEVGF